MASWKGPFFVFRHWNCVFLFYHQLLFKSDCLDDGWSLLVRLPWRFPQLFSCSSPAPCLVCNQWNFLFTCRSSCFPSLFSWSSLHHRTSSAFSEASPSPSSLLVTGLLCQNSSSLHFGAICELLPPRHDVSVASWLSSSLPSAGTPVFECISPVLSVWMFRIF